MKRTVYPGSADELSPHTCEEVTGSSQRHVSKLVKEVKNHQSFPSHHSVRVVDPMFSLNMHRPAVRFRKG